jgi:polysaccharide export outer membrane protein
MFRTPRDYVFDEPVMVTYEEYKLSPNDIITFYLYTNNGFMIIDLQSMGGYGANSNARVNNNIQVRYLIETDGYVKLPTLRKVKLAGMTIDEAESFLEKEYSRDYIDPFVIVRVLNSRVIVSTGKGGASQVVPLENPNTRLIEALSLAGGVASRGKAKEIKLIREYEDSTEVYKFDLSTIEGIEAANMIVQANDIIYVEPTAQLANELLQDWIPVLTLFTSIVAAYALVVSLSN